LKQALREAVNISDAPSVVRFSKGSVPQDIPALSREGCVDVLSRHGNSEVCIVAIGSFAQLGLEVSEGLKAQGIGAQVLDPRWVKPIPQYVLDQAAGATLVVVIEDGIRAGGVGAALSQALRDQNVDVPLRNFGTPLAFLNHAKRASILEELGLTGQAITRSITEWISVNQMSEFTDPSDRNASNSLS
jgi:1-deoxy-D-xylulose-5-phosphate synthase